MVNKIKNGIIWIRTPKCATSTIATHLEEFCKWKGMKYTPSNEHNSIPPTKYVNLGHLHSSSVNWNVVKLENRASIGSVRNPLDRFLSHYKHRIRMNEYIDYKEDVSLFYLNNYHNTNFEGFFKGIDNYLCKYLGVGDDLHWDVDILNDRYDLIIASDFLNKGLKRFEKSTGYSFKNEEYKTNTAPETQQLIITDEFLEKFKENNKNDYELYNYVLEKYEYR